MDNEVKYLNMEDIIPNRYQPREIFDEKALNELADSIRQHGVLEPILVRPVSNKYEIIAGERRYKASAIAGLTKIPALVKQADDKEAAIFAYIENAQRKDVSAIEEAKTASRILKDNNMTQEELAKTLGISQSTLANKLRLLSLPVEVQEALMRNEISERHARSLLSVKETAKQLELLNKIKEKRMTVRELDGEIKSMYNDNNFNQNMNVFNNGNTFIPNVNNNVNQEPVGNSYMNNLDNYQNNTIPNQTFNNYNNETVNNNPVGNNSSFMDFLNQYDNNNPIPATGPTYDAVAPSNMPSIESQPLNNTPQNNDFMNYLNNYDNNNPVPSANPVTMDSSMTNINNESMQPTSVPSDNNFMDFLNNYDNNNPVPSANSIPMDNSMTNINNEPMQPASVPSDNNFMDFLNNYDNNNPVPQSEPMVNNETEDLNSYLNNYENNYTESSNNNVMINDVNPPITSNFNMDANSYIEDNPNYVDVSVNSTMNSVDEIINEVKKTVDKIKNESKYKIDTDEINFDDIYQITIKIDKRDF